MPEQQITEEQRKEYEEKLKNMSPEEIQELQKKQCIFCQIISGGVPGKTVWEDDKFIAILDINPANEGHVLLMPKEHYAVLPQMPKEDVPLFFIAGKNISNGLLRSLRVEGTSLFVANGLAAGQKAQHFMLHIIPRVLDDNLLNMLPKQLEGVKEIYPTLVNRLSESMGTKKETVAADVTPKAEEVAPKEEPKEEATPEEVPAKEEEPEEPAGETPAEKPEETKESEVDLDDIARLFG